MKKLTAISLLFLYLLSLSGVAVSSNYCCSKLTSVKIHFFPDKDEQCPKKDCCTHTICFFKVHDPQQSPASNVSLEISVLQAPVFLSVSALLSNEHLFNNSYNTFALHSPPVISSTPLVILKESFLI